VASSLSSFGSPGWAPGWGWRWTGYDGGNLTDLTEGSQYFFGGRFVLLLAALWMIAPTFRRAKLDPAPAWVPFSTAAAGTIALVRWYRHWEKLDAQYRAEFGTALMVEAFTPVLLAAFSTLALLVVLGPLYAWRGRKAAALPPPPPIS
jgi:hypothetical protein